MSQEPTLFATTIFENIAMGKPGATEAEVSYFGLRRTRGAAWGKSEAEEAEVRSESGRDLNHLGAFSLIPPLCLQVRAAAEAANAQRFISHLPLQYE